MKIYRKIYLAALAANSREELADVRIAADTLATYGVFDPEQYAQLKTALDRLYWSGFSKRVMVDDIA